MPKDFEPMWTALCNELSQVLCYLQQVTFSGVAFKHLAVTRSWSCQKTNWVVGGVHIYFLSFPARDGPLTYDQLLYVFSHVIDYINFSKFLSGAVNYLCRVFATAL